VGLDPEFMDQFPAAQAVVVPFSSARDGRYDLPRVQMWGQLDFYSSSDAASIPADPCTPAASARSTPKFALSTAIIRLTAPPIGASSFWVAKIDDSDSCALRKDAEAGTLSSTPSKSRWPG
jgi:hypothetical protein